MSPGVGGDIGISSASFSGVEAGVVGCGVTLLSSGESLSVGAVGNGWWLRFPEDGFLASFEATFSKVGGVSRFFEGADSVFWPASGAG